MEVTADGVIALSKPEESTFYLLTFLFNSELLLYHGKGYTISCILYIQMHGCLKKNYYPMSISNGTCLVVGFMRSEEESESTNAWSKSLLSAVK